MRIVYCMNTLRKVGGIERVITVKANALAELPGMEVYIVVAYNKNGISIYPLSPKVHVIDLAVNYDEVVWKNKWCIPKDMFIKRKEHKKKLADILRQINPDVAISVGQAEKCILPSISGQWANIREFHISKDYRRLSAYSFLGKISARISEFYESFFLNKYDQIVVLTEEDREKNWSNNQKVSVIPNPCFFSMPETASLDNKKIISAGRLHYQKNYASLIRAFSLVVKKHPLWKLEIYGEGNQRQWLQSLINEYALGDSVFLKGNSTQVQNEMLNASCFVLSSVFEGLPLVILEAMTCGLPVVSYDCPCGPKEIITDGEDGFLVTVNDEEKLADRICFLIENEDKRKEMGKAAKHNAEKYKIDNIIPRWLNLFHEFKKR